MNRIASKGVVLVVEDDPQSLGMLNEVLIAEGYTVLVAMDGAQALTIANRMVPDIVLMDALMPHMDGFHACAALKENAELRDIPVIFMTGLSDSEHVLQGLNAGGVDYIHKPIRIDELLARLRIHLANARMTLSARSALDEIGQSTLTCDINGQLIWLTASARETLSSLADEADWLNSQLPRLLQQWLSREPQKNSLLTLKRLSRPISLRFMGRPFPGQYQLKVVEQNEQQLCHTLRGQFSLTEREAEVLLWLSRGKTNREIGLILDTSPRTINKHLEQIFKKLAVENRTSAATLCLQYVGL